jgi:hypothetical protein
MTANTFMGDKTDKQEWSIPGNLTDLKVLLQNGGLPNEYVKKQYFIG